jgi:tetratricopeptide (TPR) repeat protein
VSGNQRRSGGNRLQERAQELIERGLTKYRQGEVEAALTDWRHALALDPKATRAREYIDHALTHKDDLGDLTAAHAQGQHSNVEGSPMPPGHLDEHDHAPATEKLPLPGRAARPGSQRLEPADTQPIALPPPARRGHSVPPLEPMPLDALSLDGFSLDGLSLDGLPMEAPSTDSVPMEALIEEMPTEDTEPIDHPPPGMVQDEPPVSLAPTVELPRAEIELLSQIETAHIRTLARTQLDAFEPYEISIADSDGRPVPQGRRAATPPVVPPVVIEDVEEEDSAPVRSPAGPLHGHAAAEGRHTPTVQLYGTARPAPSSPPGGAGGTRNKLPAPATGRGGHAGDGRAGAPIRTPTRPMDPVARMLLERLEAERPADPDDDEALKDRVLWLIEYAQSEYIGGDYQTAITAVDLALDEAPDSAAVQALIDDHTESLIEIYASYEGDPQAIPALAMSASEYGQRALDSHAAFLLSRVDGMLTIDDLVTVSGMPPLETHRHLCNLLRQGILTLR